MKRGLIIVAGLALFGSSLKMPDKKCNPKMVVRYLKNGKEVGRGYAITGQYFQHTVYSGELVVNGKVVECDRVEYGVIE